MDPGDAKAETDDAEQHAGFAELLVPVGHVVMKLLDHFVTIDRFGEECLKEEWRRNEILLIMDEVGKLGSRAGQRLVVLSLEPACWKQNQ